MILVLGSINLDLIATSDRLPLPGETLTGSHFGTASGGKGANQALAAHRAGGRTKLVGAVGSDAFASQALAELENDKVDLSGIRHMDAATGIAVILVGGAGENQIVVVPGANGLVDANMAIAAVKALQPGDILLLQQEIPDASVAAALATAKSAGITSLLNIAPFSSASAGLADAADYVIANETEFAGLHGATLSGQTLKAALIDRATQKNQTIIVTCGAKGAFAASAEGAWHSAPAPAINPIDTVGAGDSFCGYLAAALEVGLALAPALTRATIAGSLACLKPGAQPAIPYAVDVDAAFKNTRPTG